MTTIGKMRTTAGITLVLPSDVNPIVVNPGVSVSGIGTAIYAPGGSWTIQNSGTISKRRGHRLAHRRFGHQRSRRIDQKHPRVVGRCTAAPGRWPNPAASREPPPPRWSGVRWALVVRLSQHRLLPSISDPRPAHERTHYRNRRRSGRCRFGANNTVCRVDQREANHVRVYIVWRHRDGGPAAAPSREPPPSAPASI